MLSPIRSVAITLHSMCHPGRPPPHGLGQDGSPPLLFFHTAKSVAFRFSPASAVNVPSDSAISASVAFPFDGSSFGYAWPHARIFEMSMYTEPFDAYARPLATSCSTNVTICGTYSVTRVSESGGRMPRAVMSSMNSASKRRECALKISWSVTDSPSSASSASASGSEAARTIASPSEVASAASIFAFASAKFAIFCLCCSSSSTRSSSSRRAVSGISSFASFFACFAAKAPTASPTFAFTAASAWPAPA